MRNLDPSGRLVLALVAALLPACGGKVVVDGSPGEGGAGGASAVASVASVGSGGAAGGGAVGATTGPGPSVGSSVASSGSGQNPGIGKLCNDFCDAFADFGCGEPKACFQDCVGGHQSSGACGADFEAIIACASGPGVIADCEIEAECGAEIDAFLECVSSGAGCQTEGCSADSTGGCACEGSCDGADVYVECEVGPEGPICRCAKNGVEVGACVPEEGPTSSACQLESGCCSAFF